MSEGEETQLFIWFNKQLEILWAEKKMSTKVQMEWYKGVFLFEKLIFIFKLIFKSKNTAELEYIISIPGRSQGLLYKHLRHWLI